jgi:PAS domain S-box-containing protein
MAARNRTGDEWLEFRRLLTRYLVAIVLAFLAQLIRIPIHPPTLIPFITYTPFIVISAMIGGFGPGVLTTALCAMECAYFAIEPLGSFAMSDRQNWLGLCALFVTGLVTSVLAERLKRTSIQIVEIDRKTAGILDNISDGFSTFDHEWRYTFINAAAAKMLGRPAEEVLGRNCWELWPYAADSRFGDACRRAVAENAPVRVEAFYAEPLNAWFDVRFYPSTDGLSIFFTDTTERRRADEHVRLMVEAAPSAMIMVDTGGCIALVNSQTEKLFGYRREELLGRPVEMLVPERFRALHDSHRVNFLSAPTARPMGVGRDLFGVSKDGVEISVEIGLNPVQSAEGKLTLVSVVDITERKQAEETKRLLSSIVECSDDAIIGKSLDGIVLTWNQGAERIYGYTPAEIVGRSISLLIPPDRSDELPEILGCLKLGRRVEHLETERVRKDGERIFVAVTMSPLKDPGGKLVGASTITRDLTERKRAEKALRLSEERYRSLTLVSDQIVWTANSRGEIEDMPMWRDFTGQCVSEVKGFGWADAVHPEDRERAVGVWTRSVRNVSFFDTEYRLRRHDGQYRFMAVHGVPVLEDNGTIREWVGTCADITERKKAEEEVRHLNEELEKRVIQRTAQWEASNKELEAFAYSVSHDLRAPLRAINGFSRILLEEYAQELSAEAYRYLEVVRKNAVQMGELIDHLLAFSRLGRQSVIKEPVDMRVLVEQSLAELSGEQEGRQVEIVIGELPACNADSRLFKQVVLNLLSNAVKFTRCREKARIEFGTAGSPSDETVYFVRDNGAGFDMRYADKLFGVFHRLHSTEQYEGTGVGLAIVQRIVIRHGGRIWAEGEVDKGATFYFSLPVVDRAPLPQSVGGQSLAESAS